MQLIELNNYTKGRQYLIDMYTNMAQVVMIIKDCSTSDNSTKMLQHVERIRKLRRKYYRTWHISALLIMETIIGVNNATFDSVLGIISLISLFSVYIQIITRDHHKFDTTMEYFCLQRQFRLCW